MLRALFITLARSRWLRRMSAQFGPARRIARRFIAGEELEDAIAAARALNGDGIEATLNHLGESVETREDAQRAVESYCGILERIRAEGIRSTLSIKPSHLGLGFGEDFFFGNMSRLLEKAKALGITVEWDIEDSSTTEATVKAFHRLLDTFPHIRLALQSYLFRTREDAASLIERGSSVRLIKGAYDEPARVAWKKKEAVRQSFVQIMDDMLGPGAMAKGFYPAFGTHDHELIEAAKGMVEERGIARDRFEFQMLLGVRRDWQQRLVREGYRVRVYVPFGSQWYPYFMRRLAERPANVLFMLRAMAGK